MSQFKSKSKESDILYAEILNDHKSLIESYKNVNLTNEKMLLEYTEQNEIHEVLLQMLKVYDTIENIEFDW